MFGNAWVSQYGDSPEGVAGSEWGAAIAGMNRASLDAGLNHYRMAGGQWPPSMGEFRAACLAIPSLPMVQREIAGDQRSPFAKLVMEHLDLWAYKSASTDKAERMLRNAYTEARTQRLLGVDLPETYVELPHVEQPFVPASPETAAKAMADIEKVLGL